jgi:ribosomal protein L37AE/L43A
MIKNKELQHCKFCKRILNERNKFGVCSNCGNLTYYQLFKKGVVK